MRAVAHCETCGRPLPRGRATLTTRQAEILAFIRAEIAARGCAPLQQAISDRFRFKSTATVFEHLRALESKGFITRQYNTRQGIELVDQASEVRA